MSVASAQIFALIGAGPSLNYCDSEIDDLIARGAHFLISDSVAAAMLRRYKPAQATVFTVEMRRHGYLRRIDKTADFNVLAYANAHERNLRLTALRSVERFKLRGEAGVEPELYSPGTVLGTMLSYAVAALPASGGEIHILGADFCYIDNQIYSRFIYPHVPPCNRLWTQETWQFEMALKKSAGVLVRNGLAMRTSYELMQSRENMRGYVAALPDAIRLVEYSPIGFDCARVEKIIPSAIEFAVFKPG